MLLTRDITEATYKISFGKNSASAVGVETSGHYCLITARHLFEKENILPINGPETKIEPKCKKVNICVLNAKNPLPMFPADAYYNDYYDVAIIDVPKASFNSMKEKGASFLPLSYLSDIGICIGTDVMLVGFPFIWKADSIGIENPEKRNGYYIPLIKSGTFCSFQPRHGAYELIDVHNNNGFSGGPVVWCKNNQSYILGTVCGYYYDTFENGIDKNSNSGFAQICAIGHALDIIRQCIQTNPIEVKNHKNSTS